MLTILKLCVIYEYCDVLRTVSQSNIPTSSYTVRICSLSALVFHRCHSHADILIVLTFQDVRRRCWQFVLCFDVRCFPLVSLSL